MTKRQNELEALVGEPVSAVCFVMDYVEFHFNGLILRALTNPSVEKDGVSVSFGDPGSRDVLCSLIGAEVSTANVNDGVAIVLELTTSQTITIPLDTVSRVSPDFEAAHYVPGTTAHMLVW